MFLCIYRYFERKYILYIKDHSSSSNINDIMAQFGGAATPKKRKKKKKKKVYVSNGLNGDDIANESDSSSVSQSSGYSAHSGYSTNSQRSQRSQRSNKSHHNHHNHHNIHSRSISQISSQTPTSALDLIRVPSITRPVKSFHVQQHPIPDDIGMQTKAVDIPIQNLTESENENESLYGSGLFLLFLLF